MLYMPAFLKRCSICEQWYPPTRQFFYSNRTGLRAECKSCVRDMRRRRYQADPEPQRHLTRRYYATNADHCRQRERDRRKTESYRERERQRRLKEREIRRAREQQRRMRDGEVFRQYQRAYRAANRERILEQERRWRLSHINVVRERNRRERAKNPEMYRAAVRRRRARELQAPGEHTADDVKRQYDTQQGRCYWCSNPLNEPYHVDHVIPLSRGGSNWPDNLVCACASCNLAKSDKLPYTEWQPPNPLLPSTSKID